MEPPFRNQIAHDVAVICIAGALVRCYQSGLCLMYLEGGKNQKREMEDCLNVSDMYEEKGV